MKRVLVIGALLFLSAASVNGQGAQVTILQYQGTEVWGIMNTQTADIPTTVVSIPPGIIPANAKGVILGVEVWFHSSQPGQAARLDVQRVTSNGDPNYPYTDVIRVETTSQAQAAMGQVWYSFDNPSQRTIRFRLVSSNPGVADKGFIFNLHGYWQ